MLTTDCTDFIKHVRIVISSYYISKPPTSQFPAVIPNKNIKAQENAGMMTIFTL